VTRGRIGLCHYVLLPPYSLDGPTAVTLNDLVNLRHQADGVVKRDDETLVVGDVLGGEGAAWLPALAAPVVEPLGQTW